MNKKRKKKSRMISPLSLTPWVDFLMKLATLVKISMDVF